MNAHAVTGRGPRRELGGWAAAREHLEAAAALCRDMGIIVWLAEAERRLAR
jgi:hypothetical protein